MIPYRPWYTHKRRVSFGDVLRAAQDTFARVDLRVKKLFRLGGRATMEIDFELLNAFDTINFNHSVAFNPGTSTDTFRVTSAYTDPNTTNDPGGRIGQLAWRINW